jgi:hypothetical protein
MNTAEKLQLQGRVAGKHELYSIVHCNFSLPGTTSLSPRARRYLFFVISLVQCGYCRIEAPMDALADAIYRAQGQTASVRTLRSALAELEAAGYLTRRRCRLGADRAHAIIEIHQERFVYWTKIRSGNVIPCEPVSHNSPHRQVLPADDRRIKHRVNTSSYSSLEANNVQEQRAGARSKNSAKKKKHHYHPIVYTLFCCLPPGPDKTALVEIARGELAGGTNRSGVDWEYYRRLWPALDCRPGGRRETTARSEIVPVLMRCLTSSSLSPAIGKEPHALESGAPPATAEQVSLLIAALSGRTDIEQDSKPELAADSRPGEQVSESVGQGSLSGEDLSILLRAREKAKHRV